MANATLMVRAASHDVDEAHLWAPRLPDRPGRRTLRGRGEARVDRQARFWNRLYRRDPEVLGAGPSRFSRWLHRWLGEHSTLPGPIVELGCGYGRDAWFWARDGRRIRAVDCSGVGLQRARSRTDPVAHPPEFVQEALLPFLRRVPTASVALVYSNLVWNMDFREEEHRLHFDEVARVLRPGGIHAYSVRSTHDPWYGRGRAVAPDTFDLAPQGSVMHFFSREYARSLSTPWFENREIREVREGGREFPIRLLYVVDRRRRRALTDALDTVK